MLSRQREDLSISIVKRWWLSFSSSFWIKKKSRLFQWERGLMLRPMWLAWFICDRMRQSWSGSQTILADTGSKAGMTEKQEALGIPYVCLSLEVLHEAYRVAHHSLLRNWSKWEYTDPPQHPIWAVILVSTMLSAEAFSLANTKTSRRSLPEGFAKVQAF